MEEDKYWQIDTRMFEAAVKRLLPLTKVSQEQISLGLHAALRDMLIGSLNTTIVEPELVYHKIRSYLEEIR